MNQWNPIATQPTKNGQYLVLLTRCQIHIAHYLNGQWTLNTRSKIGLPPNVTHWMDLPEIPSDLNN